MKILIVIIASIISAILYRMGGIGKPFNTKLRDFGVPLVGLILLYILGFRAMWWAWVLTFGAYFGSMTSYFKFDNQEDVHLWNWLLHGLIGGLSAVFFALSNGIWYAWAIRVILLSILIPLWSELMDEVNLEEGGRGFLFTITMPLLLLIK